ncbi:MAG: hypothetical protein E7035_06435 [Verrucomicrobiaceae bacterium]|nr:hypothetical protein [Verrucomicrobiaceae bacterium]
MKKILLPLITSAFITSAFAVDYTIIGSGLWYNSAIWQGGTAPVATDPSSAIDNLSFTQPTTVVKLTGDNSGKYYVKNFVGSTSQSQTIRFVTNSEHQNERFANITGNENYRVNFIWGATEAELAARTVSGLSVTGNSPFWTYVTDKSTSTTTYKYANVTVNSIMLTDNLVLDNTTLNLSSVKLARGGSNSFTSITLKNGSVVNLNSNKHQYNVSKYIQINTGTSFISNNNATLKVSDYINLDGELNWTGEKGSLIVANKIRFNGGTLRLTGSEVLTKTALSDSKPDITAISLNNYGNSRIELGGNESFDYIAQTLQKSGSKYVDTVRQFTFKLHEDTTLLSINKLYNSLNNDYVGALGGTGTNSDGSTYTWDIQYIFEDFSNGVVRIAQALTDEELTHFYADGWENFTQNSDGFLYATAVPEPAEIAIAFGVIALAFAYYRRRK